MNWQRGGTTEQLLIEQARLGNREAYGRLVATNYAGVVQVVYRMCGEAQLAEDAAQEAFLRAWLKLPTYQPRTAFRSWLYRIALNAALDVLRRPQPASLEAEVAILADPDPNPESALLEREEAERIQHTVQSLPEAARAVIVLREYGGLSYQEIAEALDIPPGTVMSRLNYARNKLRELLMENVSEVEREYA